MRKLGLAASALALVIVALVIALAVSACDNSTFYAGVTFGPPAPLVAGPVGVSPGADWIWTDGFYSWGGSSWVWVPGRWERPPRPGMVWRRPTYVRTQGGYRVRPGHWVRL